MARQTKLTKADEYRTAMEKEGVRDYKVLAFVFLSDSGPEFYHYDIMTADPRPAYYLFDCIGEMAQIVVPNDAKNEQALVELAELCGGKKTTPNLR